jgi:hypothetical protein
MEGGREKRELHDENSRANEIPLSRFSSGSSPSPLFFLSLFFPFSFFLPFPSPVTFFYFAARQRNTSAAAGSVSALARSGHSPPGVAPANI